MNLTCIICSDGIVANTEVYATHCGHVFHYPCLIQWIERSKTCPQCRNKTTEKSIHRIYLNHTNVENGDDIATLQSKCDNVQFQLMLKEKDVRNLSEKYNHTKQKNVALRETVADLESKARTYDSVIHALKDQIAFFKTKAKERDKVMDELTTLKSKLKQMENIELAVNGSREEVTEMLKTENDIDSLVILVSTLKKALLEAERKKTNMEHKFKQLQTDITKYRKEISFLETKNKELKNEIDIVNLASKEKTASPKVCKSVQKKLERVHPEVGANGKRALENEDGKNTSMLSPSVEEKTVKILGSNSPYLIIKKNCSLDFPLENMRNTIEKQVSIFKRPKSSSTVVKATHMVYNGLGGQSKEDVYPTSNRTSAGIKRHRTDVSSSVKPKKRSYL